MTRPRLINLLDDFGLGGVSRGLSIFESAPVRAVVDAHTVAIDARAMMAPQLDADIIVTHFTPNWRRLAFFASLRLRNPRATIIHVEHSYTGAWEALKVANRSRFHRMLGLSFRMADQIVCVSQAQARWLIDATGLDPKRFDVIYPYTNNPGLSALPLPEFERAAPLRIGAYGRYHEAKGFDLLITAWNAGAMPGTELIIGGYGPEEARLQSLAGDAPGIRFVGKIDEVAAFLGQCDVVAVPSRWEAFGQVATEVREAGRPVLVSPIDGLPEQVGKAGLVIDFTSHEAIRTAFAGLNTLRLTEMAIAARQATYGCGVKRQQDWAALLARLTHAPRAARVRPSANKAAALPETA